MEPASRALLMSVAYRLLGSASDAEDAVQEAYARWYALDEERRAEVRAPAAWLVTAVGRICLDVLKSARVRRERYVGPWLPEPIPGTTWWTGHDADPADLAVLDETLTTALLVVLDTMSPAERVAFVLHDAFGYPYAQIGRVLDRSPQACRQLASQARRKARQGRDGTPDADRAAAAGELKRALRDGDVDALLRQLDPDVVAVVDGGGRVSAALEPVRGAAAVAHLLLDVYRRQPDLAFSAATVNARPGLVARDGAGTTLAVLSLGLAGGRINHLWVVRNPEKLAGWGPDLAARPSPSASGGAT